MSAPPKITLIQYPGLRRDRTLSPPCAKVHMALGFKRQVYEIVNVSSPGEAKRHNPRGRVPVLRIDGEAFVDSSDILGELDRRFPDPPLEPEEPGARAAVKVLEDWADEVVYFYSVYFRWCVPANFERLRATVLARLPVPARWIAPVVARRNVWARVRGQGVGVKDEATIRREAGECLDAAVGLLGAGPWLVGDRLTRADLSLAAVLDQWRVAQLTPDLAAEIERRPALVAWLERVHEQLPNVATG